jgi:hypothetical protein
MSNKRVNQLADALSVAGAYIIVDSEAWGESQRYPANNIAKQTDLTGYLNKTTDMMPNAIAAAGVDANAYALSAQLLNVAISAWYASHVQVKGITFDQVSAQSAAFLYTIPGNSRLEGIDFNYKSGTPVVAVGLSPGAQDILSGQTVPPAGSTNGVTQNVPTDLPLYITITGGTVDVMMIYRKNYWI